MIWVAATPEQDYVNLGDALSPVMVAALSGIGVEHQNFQETAPRMSAVGTIGHALEGSEIWVWGTGSSRSRNPGAPRHEREAYSRTPDTRLHLAATRGPISAAILGDEKGGGRRARAAVFGDPVWLLPRFYRPCITPRFELGVIVHLSELGERQPSVRLKEPYPRYRIPAGLQGAITLLNTVTPVTVDGLKARIDDILACRRIVSTSLHGMVLAETYGIPCFYFAPRGGRPGPARLALDANSGLDLRFVDFYRGLGCAALDLYVQPHSRETDWEALCRAIDQGWVPKRLDEERLIEAFPLDLAPVTDTPTDGFFDLPAIRDIALRQPVRPPAAAAEPGRLGRMIRRVWP